jgi:hypothetical protein
MWAKEALLFRLFRCRLATEWLISWNVRYAETVPVTKRTVARALAAGLAALSLSGCGAGPAADAAAAPPAQQLTGGNMTAEATQPPGGDATEAPRNDATPRAEATADRAAVVTARTVTKTKSIAFTTKTVTDSSLTKGKKVTRTAGKAGVRTLTYRVTLSDGKQTAKKLITSVVTRKPVTKVVAVGTRSASGCDPNYSGGCVPIADDVDCAGGSGNGPAYVNGPVRVVGSDIYDLDRDGDGIACDD